MQIRPTGPCPAKIMIVGEAPGEREVAEGQPFVGFSGQEMSKMLHIMQQSKMVLVPTPFLKLSERQVFISYWCRMNKCLRYFMKR